MSDKKRLTKRVIDGTLNNVDTRLYQLYNRAMSHVSFEINDMQAFEALVRDEDKEVVRRSGELYGYMKKNYYGSSKVEVTHIPGCKHNLELSFNSSLSWMPPRYLKGNVVASSLPDAFMPTFASYLEQAAPIRDMFVRAKSAWDRLSRLCDHDLSRIRYLWPAIEVLANLNDDNIDFSKLPKPRGVPSADPMLREDLAAATGFINMVMLMPQRVDRHGVIDLDLTA